MARADDDVTFGYDRDVRYEYGQSINIRPHTFDHEAVVLDGRDQNEMLAYFKLTLDEAEALAYRLLYAVNRIKEDTDEQA